MKPVVPDGIEPSSPVCKTGVVAVGPQDLGSLKFERLVSAFLAEGCQDCD